MSIELVDDSTTKHHNDSRLMTHESREHKLISNESCELAPSLTFSQFQCVLESLSEREKGRGAG
jgi:hypothetical protein